MGSDWGSDSNAVRAECPRCGEALLLSGPFVTHDAAWTLGCDLVGAPKVEAGSMPMPYDTRFDTFRAGEAVEVEARLYELGDAVDEASGRRVAGHVAIAERPHGMLAVWSDVDYVEGGAE